MKKLGIKNILIICLLLLTFTLVAVGSAKPIIKNDLCSGCGDCVDYCPVQAIKLVGNKAVIEADKCINCKICISTCQQNAIQ